uniref:Uncharacterized protein n=1 Tax=Oryza glumipatula TaxID=40148 RepID=A0A0E0BR16_9ORYZ
MPNTTSLGLHRRPLFPPQITSLTLHRTQITRQSAITISSILARRRARDSREESSAQLRPSCHRLRIARELTGGTARHLRVGVSSSLPATGTGRVLPTRQSTPLLLIPNHSFDWDGGFGSGFGVEEPELCISPPASIFWVMEEHHSQGGCTGAEVCKNQYVPVCVGAYGGSFVLGMGGARRAALGPAHRLTCRDPTASTSAQKLEERAVGGRF